MPKCTDCGEESHQIVGCRLDTFDVPGLGPTTLVAPMFKWGDLWFPRGQPSIYPVSNLQSNHIVVDHPDGISIERVSSESVEYTWAPPALYQYFQPPEYDVYNKAHYFHVANTPNPAPPPPFRFRITLHPILVLPFASLRGAYSVKTATWYILSSMNK